MLFAIVKTLCLSLLTIASAKSGSFAIPTTARYAVSFSLFISLSTTIEATSTLSFIA
jgi:hypothetical protein